jgi:hypothetical protein
MNSVQTLIIVLAVIAATALVLAFVLPYLKKRRLDLQLIIDQGRNALNAFDKTLTTLRPFFEDTAGDKLKLLDTVFAAAHIGVGNAEQLYHVGQLKAHERNAAARKSIIDTLALAGIEMNTEIEAVIDGATECEVLALGHE